MFERFTSTARAAVTGAVAEARQAGAAVVTEEHLLLALLGQGALDPLGVDRGAVAAGLAEARRRGGLSKADEQALAGLGIDLSEIVARVEQTHGEGALAAAADSAGRRRGPLRSLLGRSAPADGRPRSGHVPFSAGAKKTIEQSLRVALGRQDNSIGPQHLLLALLARPGTAADVLAAQGVTYARAEQTLG
ncbi:Clp protease N-terminal domain-containing protein [Streptomyces sp. NPDC051211]|uniref:Clp protease N-terminal domain-containing protein n=1 Tax=Streptomyces sp. NPDC051211 TaxID=3154643 RepID=UPI00344ECD86